MVAYKNIVVGTDFSTRADVAVEAAIDIARATENGRITLVHVLDTTLTGPALPYDLTGEDGASREEEAMDAALGRLREVAEAITGVTVEVAVRRGRPSEELARSATLTGADLIVTSTQGFGAIRRAILGSVTISLLSHAHCPVLVVGQDRGGVTSAKKVLAAIDLSPVSPEVLKSAFSMGTESAEVDVVSVFDEPLLISGDHPFSLQSYAIPERIQRLDEQHDAVAKLADAVAPDGKTYSVNVVPGAPTHLEILEIAKKSEPDLIVLGASGHRTWSKAIFGTNATRVISGCHVPVLVVPDQSRSRVSTAEEERSEAKEQIVFGTFDAAGVRTVVAALAEASIDADHISVVMSKETHQESFKEEDQSDQGFIAGTAVGGSVGGVLGGLASLAVSSGIGLVVVGPAVALGLIGGLIGTLVGYGVPEHDAARLQEAVESGKTLVAVHAYDADELARAKTVLADAGIQPRRMWV